MKKRQPKRLVLATEVDRVIKEAISMSHAIAETLIGRPRYDVPLSHPSISFTVVVDESGRPSAAMTLYDRTERTAPQSAFVHDIDTALGRTATIFDVIKLLSSSIWSDAACGNREMVKKMIREARAVGAAA